MPLRNFCGQENEKRTAVDSQEIADNFNLISVV